MALETGPQIKARHAREKYAHESSKIKGVLHTPLLILLMFYPTLIGFSLVCRNQNFAVVNPEPQASGPPGPDVWVTTSAEMLGRTCLAFNAVLIVHLCLVAYIRFHGRAGSLQIAPAFSWIVPVVFWFSTMTYFYHYVTIARYGVARVEWIIFGLFSVLALMPTCYMIACPLNTDKVTCAV